MTEAKQDAEAATKSKPKFRLTGKRYWSDCGQEGLLYRRIIDSLEPKYAQVWVIGRFAYEMEPAQ